jgi:hypothetical protein
MVAEITEKDARKVMDTVDAGLVTGVGIPRPGAMCVEAAVCYALGLPHGDDPDCVSRALRHLKIRLNDSNWSSDTARAMGLRRLALIQLGSRNEIDDKEFARRVAELAIRKAVPYALWCAAKIQKDPSHRQALLDAANRCEIEGTIGAADAARAAASYASYAADAAHAAAAHYAAHATHYAAYAAHYADAAASYAADAAADAAHYADAAASYAADAAAHAASYAADAAAAQDRVLSKFAEEVVQILIDMKAPGAKWLWMTEAG